MSTAFTKHGFVLLGLALLVLSYAVFALGSAEIVPIAGVWRTLVIPAYLTLLVAAVLATALTMSNSLLFIFIGVALWLAPFAIGDLLVRRLRAARAP